MNQRMLAAAAACLVLVGCVSPATMEQERRDKEAELKKVIQTDEVVFVYRSDARDNEVTITAGTKTTSTWESGRLWWGSWEKFYPGYVLGISAWNHGQGYMRVEIWVRGQLVAQSSNSTGTGLAATSFAGR